MLAFLTTHAISKHNKPKSSERITGGSRFLVPTSRTPLVKRGIKGGFYPDKSDFRHVSEAQPSSPRQMNPRVTYKSRKAKEEEKNNPVHSNPFDRTTSTYPPDYFTHFQSYKPKKCFNTLNEALQDYIRDHPGSDRKEASHGVAGWKPCRKFM